jgi:hypothetical protein
MKSINLQLKRLGKKKIITVPITLNSDCNTLQELLINCVENEVNSYNNKRKELQLTPFLSPTNIQNQAEGGKIDFNDIQNKKLAVLNQSIENAIQSFKDGLFVVFIDDQEITDLTTPIKITNHSSITFIRMTFLSGTYW